MYASLFLARREGCSCGSGGGGARRTPLGKRFSARSLVFQSPVWSTCIARNGPLKGLWDVSLRRHRDRWSPVLSVSFSTLLASSSLSLISLSSSPCPPSSFFHSACEAWWFSGGKSATAVLVPIVRGAVRSGIVWVNMSQSGVRSGVSVVPSCASVLIVASAGSRRSTYSLSVRGWK